MIAKSKSEWIQQAGLNKKIVFFYKQKVLDVTQFINIHPGGVKAIKNYINKDISKLFYNVFPHNQNDYQTLLEYQCGIIQHYQDLKQQQKKRSAFNYKKTIQSILKEQQKHFKSQKENKEVVFQPKEHKKVQFQPNCILHQKPDKNKNKIDMIRMFSKNNCQDIFDQDQNIDQEKPTFS